MHIVKISYIKAVLVTVLYHGWGVLSSVWRRYVPSARLAAAHPDFMLHNRGKAKLHSDHRNATSRQYRRRRDHRNPHFAAMLPAGAVRMPASRSCRTSATKSPLGLFKEISPKRNFFQRDPRRGSLSFHAAKRHENSLLLRFAEARRFRALRSATKGSAFGIRKPFEKGLIENFVPWCASKGMFKVVSAKLSAAVPSRGRLEAHLNFMLT